MAAVTQPWALLEITHTVFAACIASGFLMTGVSARRLLRRPAREGFRTTLKLGLAMGLIFSFAELAEGRLHAGAWSKSSRPSSPLQRAIGKQARTRRCVCLARRGAIAQHARFRACWLGPSHSLSLQSNWDGVRRKRAAGKPRSLAFASKAFPNVGRILKLKLRVGLRKEAVAGGILHGMKHWLFALCVASVGLNCGTRSSEPGRPTSEAAFDQAARSARIAGLALTKVQRWLHERALPKIDPQTGLYIADGHWNYRDTAADCYPFLAWAAWAVDREALNGPVRGVLHAEQRLCNELDRIPVPYDLQNGRKQKVGYEQMVFEASEYVKDGLIAIVEATGKDEWFDRMRDIEDDLWRHARVQTPFGPIPTKNIEVNGEQTQVLARLYAMTGEPKYLRWAERLADYYLSQADFVPNRLRDHGCEIIGGLGLLLGVEADFKPEGVAKYAPKLRHMYDRILAEGCNKDGMMYNEIRKQAFGPRYRDFSDGWGYNYVGFLCYDMALGKTVYRPKIEKVLAALAKPIYRDYRWEGSIDGIADSAEGAIYLLNRVPVPQGFAWLEREARERLVFENDPNRLWGTMKLEANGVRTVILYAMRHTQGLRLYPWRPRLELGAAPTETGGLAIWIRSPEEYRGRLEFDAPRHRLYMGFRRDWPRMNTLPEWFTAEPEARYRVREIESGRETVRTGRQLSFGCTVELRKGETLRLLVEPVK